MSTHAHTGGSELPTDILRTVAYFDLFDYPVTSAQIYTFLQRNSVSSEDVRRSADELVREGKLQSEKEYFFLPGSDRRIAERRRSGEQQARRMLIRARIIASLMKRVPFIRGVFLTGSLSKEVADQDSDIDFMIVTVPERLWLVRTMLTLFRKLFLFGNSKYLCTNFYITENGYALQRRNLYTAIEVVTTKVLWNAEALTRFRTGNGWTKEFLPNSPDSTDTAWLLSHRRSFLQRLSETCLSVLPLRAIERRLMDMHRRHWNTAFRHVAEPQRELLFIASPEVSACWPDDRQAPVLTRYHRKLEQLGLR